MRALLLKDSEWNLARQNLNGVLETTQNPELKLLALTTLALGQQQHSEPFQETWLQAAHLASDMRPQRGSWLIHLALAQADQELLSDREAQALITLVNARGLALELKLPALAALTQLEIADVESQLADWPAFAENCRAALELARQVPEPWLVDRICGFWVDRQLSRSSDRPSTRRCLQDLQRAEAWFTGPSRVLLLGQLSRLQDTWSGLATLDRALRLRPPTRFKLRLLAERYHLTPANHKQTRRQLLGQLQNDLNTLGKLEAEDPVSQRLPRFGIWAATGDTYLPEDPQQAEECFQKALTLSTDRTARLRVLSYRLQRYAQTGVLRSARTAGAELIDLIRQSPLDRPALAVVRAHIIELNGGSRHLARLLLTDDIRPPAESPVVLVLTQLLNEEGLQSALDREVYNQLRQARSPQETCRAYMIRAQLLLAQNRTPEAALALEKMAETAEKGDLPLHEANARRLQAEINWSLGNYTRALESCQRAERLYAASPNAQDQQASQECKLVRAYFLMRTQKVQEALWLCQQSNSPWFTFLAGRCHLQLNQREQAEKAFAACHFEDTLAEAGRTVFQARASDQPDPHYARAYELARSIDSVSVREICLDWAPRLKQSGQTARAQALEEETRQRLTRLFDQYPPDVRERLYDQPLTQQLFPQRAAASTQTAPRQSRRSFLAALNDVRQRYPRLDNELAVTPTDLVALQESIPPDRVLVQYFAGEADLYAMRVDSEGCRLIPMAVEKNVLHTWIEEVRQALSHRRALPEEPARRLYLSLVACLGPGLENKQIQVIPGGQFWYLPWDVLKAPDGRYLVESLNWSCVSPSELLRSRFKSSAPRPGQILTLGGSNPDLPATAEEARLIASLFPRSQALLGEQANSKELMRLAPSAEILHIASHSGLSRNLNGTFIELADGPFTLEQVYGLNLRPNCRVILSSCESALGQSEPGREVSSLATAFLVGGASTVVATLWRVEDNTSKAFFQRFYPHLLRTGSPAQALRQARLESLADPPWGWGAYQLVGQP